MSSHNGCFCDCDECKADREYWAQRAQEEKQAKWKREEIAERFLAAFIAKHKAHEVWNVKDRPSKDTMYKMALADIEYDKVMKEIKENYLK